MRMTQIYRFLINCDSRSTDALNSVSPSPQPYFRLQWLPVTHTKLHIPITAVFIRPHWLPLTEQINFKILTFVYKSHHALALPTSLTCLPTNPLRHCLCLPGSGLPLVPRALCSTISSCAFTPYTQKLWRSLPQSFCPVPLPFQITHGKRLSSLTVVMVTFPRYFFDVLLKQS